MTRNYRCARSAAKTNKRGIQNAQNEVSNLYAVTNCTEVKQEDVSPKEYESKNLM